MPSDPAKSLRRWLNDILYHVELAQGFTADLEYEPFHDDLRTVYAVIRYLEIISEASRRLPDDLKARYPTIAWKEMAGAGNVYRHENGGVATSFVRVTVQDHLPVLRDVVVAELAGLNSLTTAMTIDAELPNKTTRSILQRVTLSVGPVFCIWWVCLA